MNTLHTMLDRWGWPHAPWAVSRRHRSGVTEASEARAELSCLLSAAKREADAIIAEIGAPGGQRNHGG